jgi:hypothetical protein
MMFRDRRVLIALSSVALIVALVVTALYIVLYVIKSPAEPGIYIHFTGPQYLLLRLGETCIKIDLVEPEQATLIAFKCFGGLPSTIFIPYKLLEPGLRKWWESLSKRNVPENVIKTTEVGLIVTIGAGENSYINSLPIPLDLYKNLRAIQYTVAVSDGSLQIIEIKEITTKPLDTVAIE